MAKYITLLAAFVLRAGLAQAVLVVNEVCYDNSALADETGDTGSDWIELYNRGPDSVNVSNYGLGDSNPYQESKGVRLPNYTLQPGGCLVVFASGDRPEYTAWTNAPDRFLIEPNATWRYRSSQAAPDALWPSQSFNDASWGSGIAPFGYNDAKRNMDSATVLSYGADPDGRYPAAYFRKTFTVVNPAVVTGLLARVRMADGMVVYLNGRELLRQNMPEGPVAHATQALTSTPPTQWSSALLATNGLIRGENVLAVEVHKALASSPALIMDMTLTGLVDERVPVVHGQFSLGKEGENIHLFNSVLTRIQLFSPPGLEIGENRSYGAAPDGSTASFQVYAHPTPGVPNASQAQPYSETLVEQKPIFSIGPGMYAADQIVTLSTPAWGYRVYYTLDGSDPRLASSYVVSGGSIVLRGTQPATNGLAWVRTNPLEVETFAYTAAWQPPVGTVDKAVVLRAVAVDAEGKRCSPETSGHYFIGERFLNRTLPVVTLSTNPDNLFGFASGIYVPGKYYADSPVGYGENKWGRPYANYYQDGANQEWERPVTMALFEPSQSQAALSLVLGSAVQGGSTRTLPQKTLSLRARAAEYGSGQIDYALFPQEQAASYKRFLLRNSGNDWYGPYSEGVATMMKDAVFHELAKTMNFGVMAYRPSVVYVNGEYWGLHNMRESYDKYYFATRYGLVADNVDMLQHEEDQEVAGQVKIASVSGDANADEEYLALLAWVEANTLASEANYQYIQTQMDVANYTDYMVAETFFANTDWPVNNCDFWRAHTNQTAQASYGDTRWRWMLSDLDMAGGKGSDYNMFAYLSSPAQRASGGAAFLINALWQNAAYRQQFVARYETLLNTVLRPERTAGVIAEASDRISPEIETHFRRWGRTYTQAQWQEAVDTTLTQFTRERHEATWGQLDGFFGLGGSGLLTVRNGRADGVGGSFVVNDMVIEPTTPGVTNRAAWSGRFFCQKAVVVQAVPDPGYVFAGWEGMEGAGAALSLFVTAEPLSVVARFLPAGAASCTVAFDAGGGTVEPASKTVYQGDVYGALPDPAYGGFTFGGWWTGQAGAGSRVTADTLVTVSTNHTLHALWVSPLTPVILTGTPLPQGVVGEPYGQTLEAGGGTPPYTWSILSGSLPVHLTLSDEGVITGTPATATVAEFTVQVRSADALTATKTFSLTIEAGPPPPLPNLQPARPAGWGDAVVFSGVTGTFTDGGPFYADDTLYVDWAVRNGGAAAAAAGFRTELHVDGVLRGSWASGPTLAAGGWLEVADYPVGPLAAGEHTVTITTDAGGSVTESDESDNAYSRTLVVLPALTITTVSPLPAGRVGVSYSQTLAAGGGVAPYTWTVVSGALPAELSLGGDGVLSGTPSEAAVAGFTVRVADAEGRTASKGFSLTVEAEQPRITTPSPLPPGVLSATYSQVLTAGGGTPPYAWAMVSGSLPQGLALSDDGVVSGIPRAAASASFTLQVTDSGGQFATQAFSLTISAARTEAYQLTTGVRCELGPFTADNGQTGAQTYKVVSGKLPPGIRAENRGDGVYLAGVPSAPGRYQPVIQFSTKSGTVTTPGVAVAFDFTVAALDRLATGIFNGWVTDSAHGSGTAQMTVSVAGRISGKLSLGGARYTLSAPSYNGMTNGGYFVSASVTSGKAGFPARVTVWPDGRVAAELTEEPDAGVFLFRNNWSEAGGAEFLAPYIGYYTATLPGGGECGSGYLTFTVDKAGKVKVGGKLADGTAVSLSGTLIVDELGRVCATVYAAPAAYKGGGVFGVTEFVDPEEGYPFLRPLDGAPFVWQSLSPQATPVYGAGFDRELGLVGGWYSKTDNLHVYYRDKDLVVGTDAAAPVPWLTVGTNRYASVWWDPDGIGVTVVTNKSGVMTGLAAPAAGKPVDPDKDGEWDYGAANSVGLKIGLTRATGVFKGSFLAWFDYPVKKHVSKSLAFEGVLTPERENPLDGVEGRGYFLWPDKAVPPAPAKPYSFKWSYDFLLLAE